MNLEEKPGGIRDGIPPGLNHLWRKVIKIIFIVPCASSFLRSQGPCFLDLLGNNKSPLLGNDEGRMRSA